VLSQADTDLLALQQARTQLPADFAPLHLAHVGRLEEDAAVDRLLDELLPGVAVVLCRLHSARSFAYGLAQLQTWAETTGGFLLCIPAVEALDPELMARSTVGVPLAHLVNAYFQCGGSANLANALQCLSDHLLLTGWGYEPPEELPLHGVYRESGARSQGAGDRSQGAGVRGQVERTAPLPCRSSLFVHPSSLISHLSSLISRLSSLNPEP
jgi:cobaltochelatase CobN